VAIHKIVRRLTAGCRCIVILGGRVFISTALHGSRGGSGLAILGWPHLSGAGSAALPQDPLAIDGSLAQPGRYRCVWPA
jgi:hypothetical protein